MTFNLARKARTPETEIDLGLAILGALLKPGETLTCADIAAWTGTSKQQVQQMEKRAVTKLREALRKRGITHP